MAKSSSIDNIKLKKSWSPFTNKVIELPALDIEISAGKILRMLWQHSLLLQPHRIV
ncbi:hypothetical protein Ddye_028232 [Dipteronia dyeriana]|uniref:Uncharacterized protein n=1 Tax=Dipteronia dyeriana TaxID=168575 RepID=A0AAD9TR29_9ROSI|nr:hypothetical protein Ddye_028232 [Dipteronia dyeriana]